MARELGLIRKTVKPDFARLAAALAEKRKTTARTASAAPTVRATSRNECPRCGVPGFRGCAHQLPFEDN